MTAEVKQVIEDVLNEGQPEFEKTDETTQESTEETTEQQHDDVQEDVATQQVEELKIPENWEQGIKDYINSIENSEHKKAVYDKFKSFDDGYMQKFQSLSEERKAFERQQEEFNSKQNMFNDFSGILGRFDDARTAELNATYGTVPNYLNSLVQLDELARNNPTQFMANFGASLGVTPEQMVQFYGGNQYSQAQNQHIQQTQNREFEDYKKTMDERLAKYEQMEQQREDERVYNELKMATDETGAIKYPHLDTVADLMATFIDMGQTVDDAYNNAVYANPQLRTDLINSQMQAQNKQVETQRAMTQKPVKASAKSSNKVDNKRASVKDIVTQTLEEYHGI